MTDIDLSQPITKLWPTSQQPNEIKSQPTGKKAGKGEFNPMSLNQDDNSSLIKFTPRKDDSLSSGTDSSAMGTRPTGDPKSNKNFQNLLKKKPTKDVIDDTTLISEEETEEAILLNAEKGAQKKAATSLFELSSSKTNVVPQGQVTKKSDSSFDSKTDKISKSDSSSDSIEEEEIAESQRAESPSAVFAKMSTKHPKNTISDDRSDRVVTTSPFDLSSKTEKKEKFTTRFSTEQADISYVNPNALNTQPTQEITLKTEKPILPPAHVQDIVNQLVNKVIEIKDKGQTDTVITLKHPPMFSGASLVVSSFDTAKDEFNISFQNLTQAAKTILDMRVNQESLLLALEKKGYAVHIVTTTTQIENPIIAASNLENRQREGRQQQQQQQQQQRNRNAG